MFLMLGEPTLKLGRSGPKLGLLDTDKYSNAGNDVKTVIAVRLFCEA